MHLSFILLAAAATLVASIDAASNSEMFSAVASTDTAQSMKATHLELSDKRFLRVTKTEEEVDDDGDDDGRLDSEDEERLALGKSISLPASLKNVKVPSSLLQSADDVLAAAKNPEINKSWLTLMKKVEANPKAKQLVSEYTNQKWTSEQLRQALKITKTTSTQSDEMKAFALLLQVGTWTKRASIKSPQLDDAAVKLLQKVDDNPFAKKYANEFLEKDWSVTTLMRKLGVTSKTPKNTNEMQAFALLIRLRAQTNVQSKTGGVKTTLKWVPKSA